MKSIKIIFKKGILRILRVIFSFGILILLGNLLYDYFSTTTNVIPIPETLLFSLDKRIIIGLLLIIVTCIIGIIPKHIYRKIDGFLTKIPILGALHKLIWNFTKMMEPDEKDFKGVFWVSLENPEIYSLGLMTTDNPQIVRKGDITIKVYPILILSAFGMTSITRWCQEKDLTPSDLTVQEAMSLSLSGGSITTNENTSRN